MKFHWLLYIVFAGTIFSCQADRKDQGAITPVADAGFEILDSLLDNHVSQGIIQGAVALVAWQGEIVYHQAAGYANIEEQQQESITDIFRIASMTKQVTSVAAMILYDQGKFQLDDTVGNYIPGFTSMEVVDEIHMEDSTFSGHPAASQITIRQLFTHSSGIGYGFQDEKLMALLEKKGIIEGFGQKDILLEDNINRLTEIPLMHEPGARFTYGLNMDVLGRLVEIWSGQPLDLFFREQIFEPLGMQDTYFELPAEKRNRLVDVYRSSEQGVVLSEEPYAYPLKDSLVYLSGGADLSCTAYDYYLFCRMMLNDGEYNGVRILQPGTAQLMRETHLETGDYDMGLGFSVLSEKTSVTDARSVGTYSGGGYFGTSYWIDPAEDLVAVLMLQVYPFRNHGIYRKFEDTIYQVIGLEK